MVFLLKKKMSKNSPFLLNSKYLSVSVSRQWIFGSVYCSINSFTSSLTVSVSVFTLLALTIERYKVRLIFKVIRCDL